MPDEILSQTAREAVTSPETAAVFLTLLTIKVDDEPILYLVNDKQEIVSQGNTYTPCAFQALLPDQTSDGNKTCKLQIDNSDVALYKSIKAAIGKRISASVAVVLSTTPDVYEQGPLDFVLRNISVTAQSIMGELYDSYIQDRKFTALVYSPDEFPGMFF